MFLYSTVSSGKCDPPIGVLNGTINYTNSDPSHIFVGDVILYSCDEGMDLVGPSERYCQRDETWSGAEPECIVSKSIENSLEGSWGLITCLMATSESFLHCTLKCTCVSFFFLYHWDCECYPTLLKL